MRIGLACPSLLGEKLIDQPEIRPRPDLYVASNLWVPNPKSAARGGLITICSLRYQIAVQSESV
jgi:hypothetical protein